MATSASTKKTQRDADLRIGESPFVGQNRTKKHLAAILLAEDELSDESIAAEIGITRSTLSKWKSDDQFASVVDEYQARIVSAALKLPIAKRHERVRQLNELNDSYWQIINDRAARYEASEDEHTPAEAATGMLVKQMKIAANGKTVTEWAFDRTLDSAIKETHKQAAQELGQWEEKQGISVDGGIRYQVTGIPDDALIGVIRPGGDG